MLRSLVPTSIVRMPELSRLSGYVGDRAVAEAPGVAETRDWSTALTEVDPIPGWRIKADLDEVHYGLGHA